MKAKPAPLHRVRTFHRDITGVMRLRSHGGDITKRPVKVHVTTKVRPSSLELIEVL